MRAESSPAARRGAFPVTLGGVAPAGAAAAMTTMTPEPESEPVPVPVPESAYDAILRSGGAVILTASFVVLAVPHRALGRVPPLGCRVPRGERVP
ncbi:hypothetical protein K4749_00070 [Streptomyces sp. TRM72054]|uniref:hypothetical protein n=1 Tax=Streptomyces sp. TRM72054 TaxID=2870562 RepID=UPI001C8CF2B4|nr:hypothetical protein [Streptomyces sp. TRM72054]MBX9392033.1 hypothetical protein [Streptomyces sp. TRM72054]